MALKYILAQAGAKMGLNPNATTSRQVLLRFINEAMDELYSQSDMAGSLDEKVFKVNGDQTVALPYFVGDVRAVREYSSQIPWNINQQRPRYNQSNWSDSWRGFRLKGVQALMDSVTNQSSVKVVVGKVETPSVVVTISGPTLLASSISEVVTMDALTKTTTNQFLDITSVKKDRVNDSDVTVNDVDDKLLTIIPNNMLYAQYQIIDVSLCPWLSQDTGRLDHYLEILYKKALPWMSNDGDEFPPGSMYDNIIVNKVLQLWKEEQGKGDEAMAYDAKATRGLARKHEEQNRATQDAVALVGNPHDDLLPRVRSRRPGRYGGGYASPSGYGVT